MRILVIDDHSLIREGIAAVVRSIDPAIDLLLAGTCEAGIALADQQPCDLVLLDLQLPDRPGTQALTEMRERHPGLPVVVVSGQEDRATVLKVLDLGAKAFIPKSADFTLLKHAVQTLLDGRVYLPDELMAASILPRPAQQALDSQASVELTARQLEVLSLLVAGLPNKLIARKLDIAEATVKIHVSAVMRAFKVTSRTQVLIAVARSGMRLPPL